MFSILMAAFAPSLVHALSMGNNISSMAGEICSAGSSQLSKLDGGHAAHAPAQAKISSHFDHCPYCYTHGSAPDLPQAYAFIVPALTPSLPHPALFYQSPRPLFIWGNAQSRAPPFHS